MGSGKRSYRRADALALLFERTRHHRAALAWGVAATVGVVAMRLALPWPLRGVLEHVFPTVGGGDPMGIPFGGNPVLIFCLLYWLLSVGTGAFELAQRVWMARVASRTAHDLRTVAVSSVGPNADRSQAETADLITRVVGDVARIRADLKGILIHLGQNGLLLLAIVGLFLYLAPKLGFLFLVSGLLAIAIGHQAVERVARIATKHRRKESAYAAAIQEDEGALYEPVSMAISASSTRKDVRTTRIIGRSTLLVHAAVAATIGLALWLGVEDVRGGKLAPGELFLFIAYAITIQRRAVMIGRQVARGGKLLANTQRLQRLIDSGVEPSKPLPLKRGIRLEGVKIRRDRSSGRVRLGPLDLTIERGRRVLVLGGEGSGKSTLLELLAGRAQARRGAFHWDDEDVTECPEAVRASVAYLSDEPRFGRTAVRRLLGLPEAGLPSADDLRTLDAIGASRIVRRLPEGLEDRIASSELSPRERRTMVLGGIAIGDAPVWILDGPVDGNRTSDRRRIETIFERVGERTLVVAAPHAVAVDRFDRIVVLKNKKMSFAGTPEEWRAWRDQKKEPRDA